MSQSPTAQKLADLAALRSACHEADTRKRKASGEVERVATWQAQRVIERQFLATYQWLQDHGVNVVWNDESQEYEEVDTTSKIEMSRAD